MNKNKGFTLIELLVVIAIIGILASVVLASLNSARAKGQDAAIKSDLAGIRASTEVLYDSLGYKYSSTGAAVTACSGVNTIFADANITAALAHATTANGGTAAICGITADGSAFAVAVKLRSGTTDYWCVDSFGNAKSEPTAPAPGFTLCQ